MAFVLLDLTGQEILNSIINKDKEKLSEQNGSGFHNSFFRGKFLGNEITSAQKQAIKNGTFEDLYIGDYWVINDITWRIAHFNYWYNTGDTACTSNHIVIIPDTNLYTAKMNDTATTTGGYLNSLMKTTNLANALTTFENAFGSTHILNHRILLSNAVSNDRSSGWEWANSKVDLMSETMVFGHPVWGQSGYEIGVEKNQLALFKLASEFIQKQRVMYWLRSVGSSAYFCFVSNDGLACNASASYSGGVRPATAIYFDDVE